MNKGISYTLRFRSTMEIDGAIYTSPNTFFIKKKKKKTEQDVTNVAIEHESKMIENEKCSLVYEVCYIMIVNL